MRNINKFVRDRLVAQAEEAETRGMEKLAETLTNTIEKTSVRDDDDFYSYASDQLQNDVESLLWDAAIRVVDFHGQSFDAEELYHSVRHAAEEFVSDVRVKIGAENGIGAYEPNLPGETKEHIAIEFVE